MGTRPRRIYVESFIRGSLEDVWRRTQEPSQHERWDLRFTEIAYLPRLDETQPQRFRYATRLGFGLRIEGEGETVGNREGASGQRTSALRFWSDDPKSLIREGAGYWQYIPTDDGIRFITGYDYEVRYGALGRALDAVVFRPLIGWATAWSFDCLRLWIEQDIDPVTTRRSSLVHAIARAAVAVTWCYHGAAPKLLARHADERAMLRDAGIPSQAVMPVLALVGAGEVSFGALVLLRWRSRWPFLASIALMALATLGVAKNSPRYLAAAFNPITLNLLVAALSFVGLLTLDGRPSAANCLRRPREERR
jgi:uncharacterized membrane protein YphA (DoxX/SURF4 family)